ncbi:hypothetical protein O3M35_012962 [Rhynocoris fuscipes]|uniref:Uncharacterized protein n=1 Tax=Rhynocoris fuscipes TaxID=488301 RepID=A0AAW1CH56_9HEMI
MFTQFMQIIIICLLADSIIENRCNASIISDEPYIAYEGENVLVDNDNPFGWFFDELREKSGEAKLGRKENLCKCNQDNEEITRKLLKRFEEEQKKYGVQLDMNNIQPEHAEIAEKKISYEKDEL